MKIPPLFASLGIWLGIAGISSAANTLIDDFTVSSATIMGSGYRAAYVNIGEYPGATREIETPIGLEQEVGTSADVQVFGSLRVDGAAGVSLDYSHFDIDISGQTFLRLDFNLALNLNWVAIEFMSHEGSFGTIVAIPDEIGDGVVSNYFNLSAFSGYSPAVLANLTGIGFDFYSMDENYSFSLTHISVTSVPEPSTYALMGLGLGGLAVAIWAKQGSVRLQDKGTFFLWGQSFTFHSFRKSRV